MTIQQALDLALQHQIAGRLPQAESIYQQILKTNPNQPVALHLLGVIAHQVGKNDTAVDLITKALAIMPNLAEAHSNLGIALQELGKLDEAVASYHKALAIKPDFAEAHYNLGNALQELGKLDEAVASYHKALAIKPDYADALFNLHATRYGSTDLEPAARCLEEAAKIAPGHRKVQFFLGMIRDYQGRTEQAKNNFRDLRDGTDEIDALLDSWHYIKSSSTKLPRHFGHTPEGLRLGIEAAQTDGLVMEFGVRFGTSIRHLSTLAGQDVHGFDSFQGLPEAWHNNPKGAYTTHGILPEVPENVHLHVGLFEETLPSFLKEHTDPIRFVNVDCDLYSSTTTVFDLLGDRIVSGTVIVFDEYFVNPNWREDEFKAFQEAVEKFSWQYDYLAASLFTKQAIVLIR